MENIQQIINYLVDKKAKGNNTINLNAYAIGALDALEKSKYTEMLEMLKKCKEAFENLNQPFISSDIEQLIKEATEL